MSRARRRLQKMTVDPAPARHDGEAGADSGLTMAIAGADRLSALVAGLRRTSQEAFDSPLERPAAPALPVRLNAQTAPARTAGGGQIKIEHALMLDRIALIAGWVTDGLRLEIDNVLGQQLVARADISQTTGRAATGFIVAVALGDGMMMTSITVTDQGNKHTVPIVFATREDEIQSSLPSLIPHLPSVLAHLLKSKAWGRCLVKHCQPLPQEQRRLVHGEIEEVKLYAGFGMAACGWVLSQVPVDLWLLTNNGVWRSMKDASRYPHRDIDKTFLEDQGAYTAGAGFFSTFEDDAGNSGALAMVAATSQGLFIVSEKAAALTSGNPLNYARWAFSLPTPRSAFIDRIKRHDGALIERLIAQYRKALPAEYQVWESGTPPEQPEISVIVPLYGRADYVEHQLLEFGDDPDFTSGRAELIYVIDDPRLVETMREWAVTLQDLYNVPFRIVWGGINRGYSGANNLGCRVARGKVLALLNSDVFPLEAGWCSRMAHTLASDQTVGAVGARLEYPDGSLQHLGISFVRNPDLPVWLNTHPRAGVDVPARTGAPLEVPAATGACIAVRAHDFKAVGGLDEGFLIGDFEDTDLCLRLRERGGRIVVLPDTRLVHLERQSFNQLGAPDFRLQVAHFNAWRHSRRWTGAIKELMQKDWT